MSLLRKADLWLLDRAARLLRYIERYSLPAGRHRREEGAVEC